MEWKKYRQNLVVKLEILNHFYVLKYQAAFEFAKFINSFFKNYHDVI